MADSFKKKEREKKKRKRRQEKAERKEQRKQDGGKSTDEFMYVDEFGNLSPTPPDPTKKKKIKAEDIVLGIPPKEDSDDGSPFQRSGRVKFFNNDKGYGFIIDNKNNDSIFVHAENLVDQIQDNDLVSFEIGSGPKGPIALSVKLEQ
jgi:cold shock CspA family protein